MWSISAEAIEPSAAVWGLGPLTSVDAEGLGERSNSESGCSGWWLLRPAPGLDPCGIWVEKCEAVGRARSHTGCILEVGKCWNILPS